MNRGLKSTTPGESARNIESSTPRSAIRATSAKWSRPRKPFSPFGDTFHAASWYPKPATNRFRCAYLVTGAPRCRSSGWNVLVDVDVPTCMSSLDVRVDMKVYAARVATGYRIKDVADRSGFTPATLRYYEEIGLLPDVERTNAGYRLYDERSLDRLA